MAYRKELVTLTNMCALTDGAGNVLMIDRAKTNWRGVAFPGGHVEWGEPFVDSMKREMLEETGLEILDPKLVGVKDWPTDEGRYIVMLFRATQYIGTLTASDEGRVFWTPVDKLHELPLASDMDETARVMLGDEYSEHFYLIDEQDEWHNLLK